MMQSLRKIIKHLEETQTIYISQETPFIQKKPQCFRRKDNDQSNTEVTQHSKSSPILVNTRPQHVQHKARPSTCATQYRALTCATQSPYCTFIHDSRTLNIAIPQSFGLVNNRRYYKNDGIWHRMYGKWVAVVLGSVINNHGATHKAKQLHVSVYSPQ